MVVSSAAALESAINNAPPGRNILIAPGTYAGGTRTFTPSGTAANPIVVRAQNGTGTVTFNDARWSIQGNGLVLSRLYFDDARIGLDGGCNRIRITRCRFRGINGATINLNACVDTRIDHCDFSDYVSNTGSKGCIRFRHTNVGNGTMRRVLVDHLYVHDIATGEGTNGSEPLGSTSSAGGSAIAFPQVVFDHILFRNVGPVPEEGEIIGAKFSGGIIQFSTFDNSTQMYQNLPRTGSDWVMRSCWIEGGRNPQVMTGCLRTSVIGCRFIGGQHLAIHAGNGPYWSTSNTATFHFPSDQTRIIGNVLDTGQIRIGAYWSSGGDDHPARNTLVAANIRNGASATTGNNGVVLLNQTGTTIQATTMEQYVVATKLAPGDVGLAAPDPHCPSGPQS